MNNDQNRIIILSIETTTPVCSVAIHTHGELTDLSEVFIDKSHSSRLVPMIMELLKKNRLGFDHLSAVAVSKGPGSYTGLRIGVSTAKGICFAKDIPLIAVGTLEALARQAKNNKQYLDTLLCPMLDARRMEVYTLLISPEEEIIEPVHARVIDHESFRPYLEKNKILFIGPGAVKCRDLLSSFPNAFFSTDIKASAKTVGEIAYEYYLNRKFENTSLFEPFYLKEFQTTIPKPKI